MAQALLQTKLSAPRLREPLVTRPHLIEKLYVIASIQNVEEGFGTEAQQFLRSPKFVDPEPVLVSILNELSENRLS